MPRIPTALLTREVRVVRPRDLSDLYTNPTSELRRLIQNDVARRIAHGYYILVPPEFSGDPSWRPTIESVALGVGTADYGVDSVALMALSAARIHGVLPRAVAVGTVASPKQRPKLITPWGQIVFHRRKVSRLDLQRTRTDLTPGYVTTMEQTLLDLVRWGDAWDVSAEQRAGAVRSLAGMVDWSRARGLAEAQRLGPTYSRARVMAGERHRC